MGTDGSLCCCSPTVNCQGKINMAPTKPSCELQKDIFQVMFISHNHEIDMNYKLEAPRN